MYFIVPNIFRGFLGGGIFPFKNPYIDSGITKYIQKITERLDQIAPASQLFVKLLLYSL